MSKTTAKSSDSEPVVITEEELIQAIEDPESVDQPKQNWLLRIRVISAVEMRDVARNLGLMAQIENTDRGQEVVVSVTEYPADGVLKLIGMLTQDYSTENG